MSFLKIQKEKVVVIFIYESGNNMAYFLPFVFSTKST